MTVMIELIAKYSQSGLLLDTNILLLYVIGTYDPSRIESFKRTNVFVQKDFTLLCSLLERFRKIISTPHILTEVSNLSGQIGDAAKSDVFARLSDFVSENEEQYTAATSICEAPGFARFGITDTAISLIAKDRFLVLTEDFSLYSVLSKRGVDVINFNHIRMSQWSMP